jgi:hypothetical protein
MRVFARLLSYKLITIIISHFSLLSLAPVHSPLPASSDSSLLEPFSVIRNA